MTQGTTKCINHHINRLSPCYKDRGLLIRFRGFLSSPTVNRWQRYANIGIVTWCGKRLQIRNNGIDFHRTQADRWLDDDRHRAYLIPSLTKTLDHVTAWTHNRFTDIVLTCHGIMTSSPCPSVLFRDLIRSTFYDSSLRLYFPYLNWLIEITILLNPSNATLINSKEVRTTTDIISRFKCVTKRTLAFSNSLLAGHLFCPKYNDTPHLGVLFHSNLTNKRYCLWWWITTLLRQPVGVPSKQDRYRCPPEKSPDDRWGLIFNLRALKKYAPNEQQQEHGQTHLAKKETKLLNLVEIKHVNRLEKHNDKKGTEYASPECRTHILALTAVLYNIHECVQRKDRECK